MYCCEDFVWWISGLYTHERRVTGRRFLSSSKVCHGLTAVFAHSTFLSCDAIPACGRQTMSRFSELSTVK